MRFAAYMLRWQLSTPVLALCIAALPEVSPVWSAVIANLVGGALFYYVDKRIFSDPN